MRKLLAIVGACALLGTAAVTVMAAGGQPAIIDNSDVIPRYVDDKDVKMEDSGGGLMSPDWVKTLVIAEVNPMFASPEGTLDGMIDVLDHYQEAGVNGLWLTPVYDNVDGLGHYANYGPHTIGHKLTGTTDYTEGWKKFKAFVDEAHKRNIRIFLDVVTWGTSYEAPLYKEEPDWFDGESSWGGWAFNWENSEFREWFINSLVWLTTNMGVDGFRGDCEPSVTGYDMFQAVRERALAAGEKIAIFTEGTNERLAPAYDFDEHVSDDDNMWKLYELYTETYNIVDAVKNGLGLGTSYMQATGESGTARFYSFLLSCHDNVDYHANGNVINLGYQGILSPFIPIWFMGEEFDNPLTAGGQGGIIVRNPLNLSTLKNAEQRDYFESIKKLIRIRRQYPEIFDYYPVNHKDSNICKVKVLGLETLQAYGRYAGNKGVLVVPNNNVHDKTSPFTVVVPFDEMGIGSNTQYVVTDLLTGKEVARGTRSQVSDFQAKVAYEEVGVYLVEAVGKTVATRPTSQPTTPATTAPVITPGPGGDNAEPSDTTEPTEEVTTTTTESTDPAEVTDPTGQPTEGPATTAPTEDAYKPGDDSSPNLLWLYIVIGVVVCAGVVTAAVILVRKKKTAS